MSNIDVVVPLLISEKAKALPKEAEICHFEDSLQAADSDTEALCVACAGVDDMIAESDLLITGNKQRKVECKVLDHHISELEVDTVMHNRAIGVFWGVMLL